FSQNEIHIRGHAIEARICAEDVTNNFLPDIGKLVHYKTPKGAGVRVDDGFEKGMDIPIYYDPIIAKLIVYGKDREEAIERMKRAIDEYTIEGIETTLPFCRFVMEHSAFTSGKFDTHFVAKYFSPEKLSASNDDESEIAAVAAALLLSVGQAKSSGNNSSPTSVSKWKNRRYHED